MPEKPTIPLVFGEVLYDHFEGGESILGGAPFNVAWHLHGFGLKPRFISAVGADREGEVILDAMQARGMNLDYVRILPEHKTGAVQIKLADGKPEYDIEYPVAWDFIEAAISPELLPQLALLYHGSLALRHQDSRGHLMGLRSLGLPVFLDINLRSPWWQNDQLLEWMHACHWLKLNDEEMAELTGTAADLNDASDFYARFKPDALLMTRGGEGAWLFTEDMNYQVKPARLENMVDTVGAGDAFSAVCILGIILGWEQGTILRRAAAFAARICGQRGAIPDGESLYEELKKKWMM